MAFSLNPDRICVRQTGTPVAQVSPGQALRVLCLHPVLLLCPLVVKRHPSTTAAPTPHPTPPRPHPPPLNYPKISWFPGLVLTAA